MSARRSPRCSSRPDGFRTVFQPIVSLPTGKIAGFEALSRFQAPPERRPDEWFALAQRVGLGPHLEARAIASALAASDRPPDTYLSINLSPSAIDSPEVQAVLPDDLTGLVIEITEHERVSEETELREQLASLRERGARIAVDDAGAGYAGLQQVMRINPDIIKLDRSLVADVDTDPAKAALIDAFVRFARDTGAVVCAEGIETAGELRVVADLDVTYGQGFGLARPLPPWASLSAWVAATLSRRGLRSPAAEPGREDAGENRLAQLAARLAQLASFDDLPEAEAAIAAELSADDACLLRCVDGGESFEAVSQRRWLAYGTRLRASYYGTIGNVLATGDAVHVLDGDASADGAEVALLKRADADAMLVAPVIAGRTAAGRAAARPLRRRPLVAGGGRPGAHRGLRAGAAAGGRRRRACCRPIRSSSRYRAKSPSAAGSARVPLACRAVKEIADDLFLLRGFPPNAINVYLMGDVIDRLGLAPRRGPHPAPGEGAAGDGARAHARAPRPRRVEPRALREARDPALGGGGRRRGDGAAAGRSRPTRCRS